MAFVSYLKMPFQDVNIDGAVVLTSDFHGKLTSIFAENNVNGEILVNIYLIIDSDDAKNKSNYTDVEFKNIIKNKLSSSISHGLFSGKMEPNGKKNLWEGEININPNDVIYIDTNFKTHTVNGFLNYAVFNQLTPDS